MPAFKKQLMFGSFDEGLEKNCRQVSPGLCAQLRDRLVLCAGLMRDARPSTSNAKTTDCDATSIAYMDAEAPLIDAELPLIDADPPLTVGRKGDRWQQLLGPTTIQKSQADANVFVELLAQMDHNKSKTLTFAEWSYGVLSHDMLCSVLEP